MPAASPGSGPTHDQEFMSTAGKLELERHAGKLEQQMGHAYKSYFEGHFRGIAGHVTHLAGGRCSGYAAAFRGGGLGLGQ